MRDFLRFPKEKDIKEANKAGATSVWLRKGKYADEKPKNEIEKPKYTVINLSSVLDIPGFRNFSRFPFTSDASGISVEME